MLRRLDDGRQLVLAQLLRGLDHDDEGLGAGAGVHEHLADLVCLARQRLGRWDGQHDLAAGSQRGHHDGAVGDGRRGSGVEDAAFLPRGGLAYACGRLRIADSKGDRELEPPGTDVRNLAVSFNTRGFNSRLYWVVVTGNVTQEKSLDLGF